MQKTQKDNNTKESRTFRIRLSTFELARVEAFERHMPIVDLIDNILCAHFARRAKRKDNSAAA